MIVKMALHAKPPSGAQNRYAIRLADHQRSSPDCAGWDRFDAGLSIPNLTPYLHGSSKRKD